MPLTSIAPTILEMFGAEVPPYMNREAVLA
jgi:bisphosphoglycerate-independent phosphoglycerate mutase (AlkP superfamily)